MLTKRIIPCLDVTGGRVVKGTQFVDLRDAGNPVELADRYYREGADEIFFLDITASVEAREITLDVVHAVAEKVFVPLGVGGGLDRIEDMAMVLHAGAEKVSVNTAAVRDPMLVNRAARAFGSQAVVVAVDARRTGPGETTAWEVYTHGGRKSTGLDVVRWACEVVEAGAGELLLTSMDQDGARTGYDLALCTAVAEAVPVPVIASGGAGTLEDVRDALTVGKADAALAASIFHFGEFTVGNVKEYLHGEGVPVRL